MRSIRQQFAHQCSSSPTLIKRFKTLFILMFSISFELAIHMFIIYLVST